MLPTMDLQSNFGAATIGCKVLTVFWRCYLCKKKWILEGVVSSEQVLITENSIK